MKRKVSKLRLSPNEEALIIREEYERRRKLRLLQVREQQRCIALQIRRDVEHRRQQELQQLEEELRKEWEQQQEEKLHTLQRLYQESLQFMGHGHRNAKENEPDLAALAEREMENHTKAEERFREALKELQTQRLKHQEKQNQSINARKKALQAEKERSTKVASLPPPPLNPIQNIDPKKLNVVKRSDSSAFASTRYHMAENAVDREADSTQPDAREEAELEASRLLRLEQEERSKRAEQLEKARLRGKQALRREQLVQDRERLLTELEHMQQTDLLRRRQQVSQMPPQIFQPLYKRQEVREELQREMEFAFEDMYTGERRVKGDLVVQLVPEPLTDVSSCSQDQELDVTVEETSENRQSDAEEGSEGAEQETSAKAPFSRPAPRQALKKLLDRIRNQRTEWLNSSSPASADGSPTASRDQILEQDSSIETGSLPSDEKNKPILMDPHKPVLPPTAEEQTNEPPAGESAPPEVFTSRVQETKEEERRKKEEELEQEKQQQMFLLQELEEQKVRLEQMLLEAQQERERLKAAVTRQRPVCSASISAALPADPLPPAGEDDQTRRVRDYQQQLLDQNRVHQRSMEEARRRLEEYQRALRIRHSLTCRSILPTGPVPPPLHLVATQPEPPPAPFHLPVPPAAPSFVHQRPNVSARHFDPIPSLTRPGSSLSSKLLLDPSNGSVRTDLVSQITDSVMEKVTEHLPERLRPSSKELRPHKPPPSPPTDPTRTINPVFTGPSPPDSRLPPVTLSPQEKNSQEAQRQVEDHREVAAPHQRLQEGQQRLEEELEHMRRQKEALQALIDTDEQNRPSSSGTSGNQELGPEHLHQKRLRLLSSLLKAIEESHGGSLSHLEDPEEEEDSFQTPVAQNAVPPGPSPTCLFHPPRALKPPLTRVWPGLRETMAEQHELSAIQEVETPVNISQVAGPETEVGAHSQSGVWSPQSPESSVWSGRTLQTPSELSSVVWRERLLSGIGSALGSSDSGSGIKVQSAPSSDSGRGADFSGLAVTSCRPASESSLPRSAESDCFSTSISTGSFVASDPDQNANTASADTSPRWSVKRRSADSSSFLSAGTPSWRLSENAEPGGAELSLRSVFNDDSIQRIIDRYSRELDASLSSAGKNDVDGSYVDSGALVSPPSLVRVSQRNAEDGSSSGHGSVPGQTSEDQSGGPARNRSPLGTTGSNAGSIFIQNTDENAKDGAGLSPPSASMNDPSLFPEESFRPLIGQLADESSCLSPDQKNSALERAFGQPSAHSSMIGQLLRPPVSGSSRRLSDEPDLHIGQLTARGASEPPGFYETASAFWDSGMRPLVGELDESVMEKTGSSGGGTNVTVGISARSESLRPAASSHEDPPQQSQTSLADPPQQSQTSLADPPQQSQTTCEDSFHPLLPEVTHNETVDPSLTFHLLPQSPPDSSEGFPESGSSPSEPTPERLRSEEPRSVETSPPSFSRLPLLHDSDLSLPPLVRADVELTAATLARLTMKDEIPNADCEWRTERKTSAAADLLEEEKGILEQSQITLVSLTDTTVTEEEEEEEEKMFESVQFPEETPEEERETCSGADLELQWTSSLQEVFLQRRSLLLQRSKRRVEELKAKAAAAKRGGETPPAATGAPPAATGAPPAATGAPPAATGAPPAATGAPPAATGAPPAATGAPPAATGAPPAATGAPPAATGAPPAATGAPPAATGAPPAATGAPPAASGAPPAASGAPPSFCCEESPAELQQENPPLPPAAPDPPVEVKMSTRAQRTRDLADMHRRTRRLYEQLEEVKQQRSVRSRQEDYAKNRLKAREFHMKTLHKLRAKQR